MVYIVGLRWTRGKKTIDGMIPLEDGDEGTIKVFQGLGRKLPNRLSLAASSLFALDMRTRYNHIDLYKVVVDKGIEKEDGIKYFETAPVEDLDKYLIKRCF